MDKNKIKSFAIWARRNLINAVTERAKRIGVTENKIEEAVSVQGGFKLEGNDEIFKLSKNDRDKLVGEIREKGFEQVMEEVAYTWFNRFMGLRYMEVNDYLPSGIRVLSSEVEGKTEPDVLTRVSEVIDELNLNAEYIYELLDSGKTEDREEVYKRILVRQCNELGKIIPQMFEKISDYTELLLPDNLLEEGSVIRKIVEDIEEEDWKEEVEIIGWMYQYYISEKKDEVFAALKKNVKITKENIPAATQLFTPKWIVKYMVENSLGRLWLEGHPNEELQKEWKYYLEEAEQELEVQEELKKIREEHSQLKPEDIKVLDPCMGSGHILVYAFDVLYEIYKTAGYSEREIPRMILQNNLYGLDIDDRAAQLASFALIMKARHYNRRLFREIERESLDLNLCSIQESNVIPKDAVDYFIGENETLRKDIEYLIQVFNDAMEYGSILEVEKVNYQALEQKLNEVEKENNLMFADYRNILLEKLKLIIKQTKIMSKKYHITITNPPYMVNKNMNSKLRDFVNENFSNVKQDLFSAYIDRLSSYCAANGLMGLMTPNVWMFISSFEELRKMIINKKTLISLIELNKSAFTEATVSICTFIIRNKNVKYLSNFIGLKKFSGWDNQEKMVLEAINNKMVSYKYEVDMKKFLSIIGNPIAYWINNEYFNIYADNKKLREIAEPKTGILTGNTELFIRFWSEVDITKIGFGMQEYEDINKYGFKWFPYNKGGGYRKWYGNNYYIVNMENNGEDIKNYNNGANYRLRDSKNYFKESITWSLLTSATFNVRFSTTGFLCDVAGSSIYAKKEELYYLISLLTTKVGLSLLEIQNPTLNFPIEDIGNVPVNMVKEVSELYKINNLVEKNIKQSKFDWDSFETSWDFKVHPLIKLLDKGEKHNLSAIFRIWETECEENFEQLKANEEELNRIFIDIYGLQDELTSEVEDKDVTVKKADRERDIKSLISYAVGCMLGRYSIDAEGLIYAGGKFKDKWNLDDNKVRKIENDEEGAIISDSWVDATFLPDSDNVIPITEDEYFEDDIVSRFIDFVRTVYSNETLEENLDFIADSIGRKPSETGRQAIRRYFIKDFYKDHLKVYQKRPIYWMFESGKNDGFKALIYMHRYNEQTVAKVRTDYLHTLQRKYEAEIQRQQLIVDSEEYTAKDRTAAKKKIDRISKQIEECREYDQIVAHLANEKKPIDLDDGVKVNYEKFQGVTVINSKGKEVKMDLLAKI